LKSDLAALEELQSLDLEILEQKNELEEIPRNLEEMRADVDRIRELLERERQRLEEAEQWRIDRETQVVLHNELLNKSKAKLQAARNEKENKAAQREIDSIRKTIQEREEEAIKVMEAIDQYRGAIAEHEQEFSELEISTIQQSSTIRNLYGRALDIQLIKEEYAGQVAMKLVYVVVREYMPIRWQFVYYKPGQHWLLVSILFDDDMEQLF